MIDESGHKIGVKKAAPVGKEHFKGLERRHGMLINTV
jgi:hypothetical protein